MSDEGLALEELIEFWDARDQFLGWGNNRHRQNVAEGFRRLAASRHSEARYVCSLFSEGPPDDVMTVKRVFLAQGEHPVALSYAGLVDWHREGLLWRAAEQGHPLAMGWASWWLDGRAKFEWAERAARAGDRMGWQQLGNCLLTGEEEGCAMDRVRGLAAFGEAARLGDDQSMRKFGTEGFSRDDPERYLWTGRAARSKRRWQAFLEEASEQLVLHDEGRGRGAVLLMIGRMIRGHEVYVSLQRETAERLARMYEECISSAREGVLCWMLCARRLGLYKDVSLIVARNVWEGREAFFEKKYK